MKTNSNQKLFFSLLAFLLFLFSYSCTEKIVNQRTGRPEIKMSLKLSSEEMASSIDHYRVTISAPDIDPSIVIDTGLSQKDGYPYGTINVPAGRNRILTVEAIAFQEITTNDMILYRGIDTVDIMPDSALNLIIDLYPVPPCLKFSPRFVRIKSDSTFSLDLNVFNMKNLSSIDVDIPLDLKSLPYYRVDSAIKGSSVDNDITFSAQIVDSTFKITINELGAVSQIVDQTGKGNLAKVFVRATASETPPDTVFIPIAPVSINGDTLNPSDTLLFIDGCTVEVGTGLPPGVVISFPVEGQTFAERLTYVEGTVENGLTSTATLSLNGHVQTIEVVNGLFNQSIVLFNGQNEIIVTAQDVTHAIADTVHVNCTRIASALRVQMNWDRDSSDVDLWVTEPDSFKVYWDQKVSPHGGILDVDDTTGFGPENYSIDSPQQGLYHVWAFYNANQKTGPVITTVRIFENNSLRMTFQDTLNKLKDSVSVCRISMPDGQIFPH